MDARDSTSNRDVSSSAGGTAGGGGGGGEDDSPRTLGYTSTPRVASLDVFRGLCVFDLCSFPDHHSSSHSH
ncbi:hypothetical protein OIU84_024171 [Salix udensis]|uniref:Uncharacterized protein n=1 Tax=Salix udensis TaxID=889485 RepID=A0AAD6KGQ1_9ROSI|nr:hypothetical protein OIU84_024171 [Salix udensis]